MCHISQDVVDYSAVTNTAPANPPPTHTISVGSDHRECFSLEFLVITGHLGGSALRQPHLGKQMVERPPPRTLLSYVPPLRTSVQTWHRLLLLLVYGPKQVTCPPPLRWIGKCHLTLCPERERKGRLANAPEDHLTGAGGPGGMRRERDMVFFLSMSSGSRARGR